MEHVTQAYLSLLEANLSAMVDGSAPLRRQDHTAATYVPKRGETDYQIDWTWPAQRIHNLIRAVTDPYPGAFTRFGERRLRVWSARQLGAPDEEGPPGQIAGFKAGGAVIRTGAGAVLLGEVQWEGQPRAPAAAALAGVAGPLGT